MKFVKTQVNQLLLQKDGKTYQPGKVKGYLCEDSGLNIVKGYKCWIVSHEQSGKLIFESPLTFTLTKQVVTLLAKVIDWTIHEDKVLEQAMIGSKKSDVLKQIRLIKTETDIQTIEKMITNLDKQPIKPFWQIDEN